MIMGCRPGSSLSQKKVAESALATALSGESYARDQPPTAGMRSARSGKHDRRRPPSGQISDKPVVVSVPCSARAREDLAYPPNGPRRCFSPSTPPPGPFSLLRSPWRARRLLQPWRHDHDLPTNSRIRSANNALSGANGVLYSTSVCERPDRRRATPALQYPSDPVMHQKTALMAEARAPP